MMRHSCSFFIALAFTMGDAFAEPVRVHAETPRADISRADKSDCNLFNPVPRELMREMSTDRPDTTESPYSVDAGHFQVEMSFFSYMHDRYNPERSNTKIETWNVAPMNLKAGLLNNVDLQLVIEPYIHNRETVRTDIEGDGVEETVVDNSGGFGDVQTRVKVNLWGNDGGSTALAVMPYVKFPSAGGNLGNEAVEGGIIIPFGFELPAGWSAVAMHETDFNRDEIRNDHHPEFLNSISVGHDIVGELAAYMEFVTVVSMEEGSEWAGTIGVGLTYAITEDIQLDGGVNFGVTRAADDFNPFIGISARL
jgi:outer membrane putative beta-barrel porin/alpha-amylase